MIQALPDEASRLDRPGVFRLNVGVGRQAFERQLGFAPAAFGERRGTLDVSRLDAFLPHPAYGTQGRFCILDPRGHRRGEIGRLLAGAHKRAPRR